MRLSLLAIAAVLALSGCNTYYENTYEKIYVRTPGIENADCDLYTAKNRYDVMTPRLVLVERSDLPLTVICRKTGYYQASVIVKPEVSAPYMPLNLANGVLPGAAADIASNSVFAYPDAIIVTMLPMPVEQLPVDAPYELQKKPEEVKPAPIATAPPAAAADKSLSKSGRK